MKQLDVPPQPIDITGYLIPWDHAKNCPVCVNIEGTWWLPLFSTRERLETEMHRAGFDAKAIGIKKIDDVDEFLISTSVQDVPLAIDIHHVNGRVRFKTIPKDMLQ